METVLITGPTSGIGYELAKIFAGNKFNLILVARDKAKLAEIKKQFEIYDIKVKIISKDLSNPKSAQEIYEEVKKDNAYVDILVNNAGFGSYGFFDSLPLEEQLSMMNVNMVSLVNLTGLFTKDMVKKRKGRILNVASMAAFFPGPKMAVYHATKAFVLSFSEALGNELHDKNITVTALCPGPVKTNFAERAHIRKMKFFTANAVDPGAIALSAYSALMKGKAIVIPGWRNRMMVFLARFAPRNIVVKIVRRVEDIK